MTVERDIAGIALPFAAGTFAAVYLSSFFHPSPTIFIVSSLACAFILSHPLHKNLSDSVLKGIILLMAILCGAFIGFSSADLSLSPKTISLTEALADIGSSFKRMTASVPFEDPQTNAIFTALITGDRSGLSQETTNAFRESGASHILALSGLHLGIIYGILRVLLPVFGNSNLARGARSIAIMSACTIYTLATGAGASITRALLFILLGECAALTGRHRSTGTILLSSLLLQLTISPESAGNIGFQLSYAAMAGIAFIYPWLKGFWPEPSGHRQGLSRIMRRIWNSAAMSVACQLTTGPLAWLYFDSFPQYFLLTNLLALPLVGIIIPLGILTMLLSASGICPAALVSITESLTCTMTFILQTIASL